MKKVVTQNRADEIVGALIVDPEFKSTNGGGLAKLLHDRVVQDANMKGVPQWMSFRYICHAREIYPDFRLAMDCLKVIRGMVD